MNQFSGFWATVWLPVGPADWLIEEFLDLLITMEYWNGYCYNNNNNNDNNSNNKNHNAETMKIRASDKRLETPKSRFRIAVYIALYTVVLKKCHDGSDWRKSE